MTGHKKTTFIRCNNNADYSNRAHTLYIITIESAQRPREHSPDQCRLRNTVQTTTLSTSTISTTLYFTQDTCKYIYTTYCKYPIVLAKFKTKVKFKLGGLNPN